MKSEQLVLVLIAIVVGVLGWQTYQQFTGRRSATPPASLISVPATAASTSVPTTAPSILPAFDSSSDSETTATSTPHPSQPALPEAAPVPVAYTAKELRDPFLSALPEETVQTTAKPSVVKDEPIPAMHLEGLMYGQGIARAILDGHIVGEGDYIGRVQVIQIMRDGVLLGTPNRRLLLRTDSPSKK